ncbi:MAG: thioredoxin family protein, partial [Psychromonas sp.]|nr:thioredoxin family protein [Psychromonas sp.]
CEGSEQVNLQPLNTSQKVADINRLYNGDRWYEDSGGYEAALSVAESYDAPMIIYFRTDWCSYCVAVDKKLLPKSGAKRAIESFVKIKINPDHGAKEKKIFEGMGGTGYPTFLVRSAEGKVSKVSVTPRKGSERRNKGYKSLTVDEFVTKMEKHQPKI